MPKVTYFAVENDSKEGKCVTTKPENFRSPVWKHFSEIVDVALKNMKALLFAIHAN